MECSNYTPNSYKNLPECQLIFSIGLYCSVEFQSQTLDLRGEKTASVTKQDLRRYTPVY